MNKTLKKVLRLKSNKKTLNILLKKVNLLKEGLKKVYPLKKVNLRRAPKIELNPKKVGLLKKVLKKVLFHKITFLTFIFEECILHIA